MNHRSLKHPNIVRFKEVEAVQINWYPRLLRFNILPTALVFCLLNLFD